MAMAMAAIRSRRLLPTLSALITRQFTPSTLSRPSPFSDLFLTSKSAESSVVQFQSRSFKSTPVSFLSSRNMNRNDRDEEKLDPDAILFEGCDYNHWLITMDFPKDPKPSPEEMVETYVQTCAKGLNISVEEAKQKIYACSTTTYQGFQAIMTEAESEQFQGLPGVVFILPDSYIDPVNKEYGGDKYINGTIIPRPPPVQYNRGRNERNNRPRYDNQRGPPGSFNNQQGPMQGDGRNYGPPRNMPQQNYGQPGQVPPLPPPPVGFPQGGQGKNFNQPRQGNYYPQEQRAPPPGDQRFGPSERAAFGDNGGYNTPSDGFQNFASGQNQNFGPGAGQAYSPGTPNQGFGPRAAGGYGPGTRVEQRPGQGQGQGFGPGLGGNYGPGGRAEQAPGQAFGPGAGGGGGGYAPGPIVEQGLGVSGGYSPADRFPQGPNEGFASDGDYKQGNQGR